MSNTNWERETLLLLEDAEKEKRSAELALERARQAIQRKEQDIAALKLALEQYRKKYGLPTNPIPSTTAKEDYGHLGPSAAVALWADRHNGEVIIKEVVNELVSANAYSDYRMAYNGVYTVLKRGKNYQRVKPGHFRRIPSQTQPPLATETPEVFARTPSDFVVDDQPHPKIS